MARFEPRARDEGAALTQTNNYEKQMTDSLAPQGHVCLIESGQSGGEIVREGF